MRSINYKTFARRQKETELVPLLPPPPSTHKRGVVLLWCAGFVSWEAGGTGGGRSRREQGCQMAWPCSPARQTTLRDNETIVGAAVENYGEEREKQYKCPDNLDKGQVLFFDGGARGNGTTEGPSGSGAVEKREGRITWQADRRLPSGTSNNVAEYVALLLA